MNEQHDIRTLLSKELESDTVHLISVELGSEFYGYHAIIVKYDISTDAFDNGEYEYVVLNTAKHTAEFFDRIVDLEKLSFYFTVYDDPVTVEPIWFDRNNILKWFYKQISDEAFLESKVGYWNPPPNLLIKG
jgi:hypothetical protein